MSDAKTRKRCGSCGVLRKTSAAAVVAALCVLCAPVAPAAPVGTADATTLLLEVTISPESRVKADAVNASAGGPPTVLRRGEWRAFRVRVRNEARATARLRLGGEHTAGSGRRDRWLEVRMEPDAPLSGRATEERTLLLRPRETGLREARFTFDVGQGTQDLGFRGDVSLLFRCRDRGEGAR